MDHERLDALLYPERGLLTGVGVGVSEGARPIEASWLCSVHYSCGLVRVLCILS